jgi:predicted nucleic acid-binding protein
MDIKIVLMDDIKARTAAETAGLSPKGTLWLLLKAVKRKILNFDQFLVTLEDIVRSGFYIKEDVFLKAVHTAKNLSTK